MCTELAQALAEAGSEVVTGACFGHRNEPFEVRPHPAPSPGSPGSLAPGRCLECCCAHCHSCGDEEEEEGAAAAGPWVTTAWEPWQSFV